MGLNIPMTSTRRKNVNPTSPHQAKLDDYVRTRVRRVLGRGDNDTQTSLRLPRTMYDALSKAAEDHGSGIGEEIRERLEASIGESPAGSRDPRFGALLTALAHVAAGAARMYPARRLEYQGRTVEDITAHWVFEGATHMLLDAFRPEGIPDGLPIDHDAAMAELSRRADRLVSAALGALGECGAAAFDNLSELDQEGLIRAGFSRAPEQKS
jgi:hypothetical protein